MADFALSVIADLKRYQTEIAKIPGMTDKAAAAASERLVRQLSRGGQRAAESAEAAATRTASSVGSMTASTKAGLGNLAQQLSDVAIQMESGTPIGRIMLQQGTQVADAVRMMGVSFGTLVRYVAPIAVVVGVAMYAWSEYNEELRETKERQEQAAEAAASLEKAVGDAYKMRQQAADALALAEGRQTDAYQKSKAAAEENRERMMGEVVAIKDRIEALNAEISVEKKKEEQSRERGFLKNATESAAAVANLEEELARETATLERLHVTRSATTQGTIRDIIATDAATDAKKKAEEASRKLAKRLEEELEARRRLADAQMADAEARVVREDAITAGVKELQEIEAQADGKRVSDIERVNAALEEQLAHIRAVTHATEEAAMGRGGEGEAAMVREQGLRAEVAAEQAAVDEIAEIRAEADKKAAEEAQKRLDQQRASIQAVGGYISQGLGAVEQYATDAAERQADVVLKLEDQILRSQEYLTEEQRAALEERLEAQKAAARKAFRVQQIAAVSQALVNTALAVSEALASAPPPFNVIPAGIALAAGAAQVGIIASQQPAFHRGTDEVSARLLPGEAVLSRQGAPIVGRENIRAANAGASQRVTSPSVSYLVYDGRVIGQAVYDQLRKGGMLASHMARTSGGPPVGHRS